MISYIKFTISEVNNSERIRESLKLLRDTFYKNLALDLDRVLSNFAGVEDSTPTLILFTNLL